jgi:hypothetical protein
MSKKISSEKKLAMIQTALPILKAPPTADEVGFLSRILVQVSLPHRDPGNDLEFWQRSNGNASLTIQPGFRKNQHGQLEKIGYPYGTIPRLVFLYLCREAIRTKSRVISLGDSLSEFLNAIGLEVSGGATGTIPRFKMQLERLFEASVRFRYDTDKNRFSGNGSVAAEYVTFWDEKNPEQKTMFKCFVKLNQELFDEILKHPVPLDMRIIKEIRQSPLALDLYSWLTHRVSYLERDQRISWEAIAAQVGGDYKDIKEFRNEALKQIEKIRCFWPQLRTETVRGGLLLKPSSPSVKSIE